MKVVDSITLLLVMVGGINWGLVGAFNFNLVAAIFGDQTTLSRLVYVLVGLSALWQIVPFLRSLRTGQVRAETNMSRSL